MSRNRRFYWLPILAGALLLAAAGLLWPQARAEAQCGSQASSCKNCHEVQGKKPVNNDGKSWHQSHAFGDFCTNCHAGNVQTTDKTAAHTGMVAPLSDIKANCAACHPNDTQARAQKYAAILGVQISSGGSGGAAGQPATPVPATPTGTASSANNVAGLAPSSQMVVNDPNTLDYVQQYKEVVLGQRPVNWGNVILLVLIGLVLFGGGAFVLYNEGWIAITVRPIQPVPAGYPKPAVDLLPQLSQLDSGGLAALGQLLRRPSAATELFQSLVRYAERDRYRGESQGPTAVDGE